MISYFRVMRLMKLKIISATITILILAATSATALLLGPFPGWSRLENISDEIVIVGCDQPLPSRPNFNDNVVRSDSQVLILSTLKGTNSTSSTRFLTNHELQVGHQYLVFGDYEDGAFCAFEDYRVIPLGTDFPLKSLEGKTLDEQLQILFQRGVDDMNRKIQEDEEEKDRLEQGVLQHSGQH